MTRLNSSLCLAALAAVAALLSACGEKAPDPPEERLIYGSPVIEKADDGTISSITITTLKGRVYHIEVDDKSKPLAELTEKRLAVKGMYARKGQERWMSVMEFKEAGGTDNAAKGNAPAEPKEGAPAEPEKGAPTDAAAPAPAEPKDGTPAEAKKLPETK